MGKENLKDYRNTNAEKRLGDKLRRVGCPHHHHHHCHKAELQTSVACAAGSGEEAEQCRLKLGPRAVTTVAREPGGPPASCWRLHQG